MTTNPTNNQKSYAAAVAGEQEHWRKPNASKTGDGKNVSLDNPDKPSSPRPLNEIVKELRKVNEALRSDLDIKSRECEQLSLNYETRSNECEKLKSENTHLKSEVDKQKTTINTLCGSTTVSETAKKVDVMVGAREPTIQTLRKVLVDLESMSNQLSGIGDEINKLYDNARKSNEKSSDYMVSDKGKKTLEGMLDSYKVKFKPLAKDFTNVRDKLKDLSVTVENAKRNPISDYHLETISSYCGIPLNLLKENSESYKALVLECSNQFPIIQKDIDHTNMRFVNAATHINSIFDTLNPPSVLTRLSSLITTTGEKPAIYPPVKEVVDLTK